MNQHSPELSQTCCVTVTVEESALSFVLFPQWHRSPRKTEQKNCQLIPRLEFPDRAESVERGLQQHWSCDERLILIFSKDDTGEVIHGRRESVREKHKPSC